MIFEKKSNRILAPYDLFATKCELKYGLTKERKVQFSRLTTGQQLNIIKFKLITDNLMHDLITLLAYK